MKSAETELRTQSILEMWHDKGTIFQPLCFCGFVLFYFALWRTSATAMIPLCPKFAPLSRSISHKKPNQGELRRTQRGTTSVLGRRAGI